MPLQWRLFLPEDWASDAARRGLARIPADITHREKWRLALGVLDTPAGWGPGPPTVVADAVNGTDRPSADRAVRARARLRPGRRPQAGGSHPAHLAAWPECRGLGRTGPVGRGPADCWSAGTGPGPPPAQRDCFGGLLGRLRGRGRPGR
ncbi:transposase [Streptomyces sp. NPDC059629]|uniref:transposase n=1 Tax=Streptomyces sp. NPDC059629 TaxID=3346889 RepID=UPI0036A6C081